MKEEDFMREAIRLSIQNVREGKGGPFAALVVKDGKIIARGTNLVTSTNDPTAHAEIVAIRAACETLGSFQLTGCEIYTTCEPCPMCMGAIYWARPDKVFFANTRVDAAAIGFDDSFLYDELSHDISERQIPMTQLLHSEALAAFNAWDKKPDKVKY
ncbi:MAG: guanine deaminase [[Candidatus Thermochlorobacteriaceae] bacterium GBChlB]|jgi:tRNA(Arg) A34 adenosine deaminase TadA|nr:MAG: guanine deaminase [[Candidatus Thermochlorobacteriaceae] bacterium GBChlB]